MKLQKKLTLAGMALALLVVMTGCVQRDSAGNPTGIIWDTIGQPMSNLITFFATNFNLGYGLAIIVVTIIARLILFPLGVNQAKKMMIQQEKMSYMKAVLEPIQAKVSNATSPQEKMAAQQEMQQAYKDAGVSMMGGMGCLPILIQMPIFSALFFAAQHTPGIQESTFLGIHLGQTGSIPLIAATAILYFGQAFLSMVGVAPEQRKQQRTMMFMSPMMMVFFAFSSPNGVALYWAVGGFFAIAQTAVTNIFMKPRIKAQIAEEMKNKPIKIPKAAPVKDVTPKSTVNVNNRQISSNTKGRNAGKQNRK